MKRFMQIMLVLQVCVLLVGFAVESLPTIIIAGLWSAYDYKVLKSL